MSKTEREKTINIEAVIRKAVKEAMKKGLEAGIAAGKAQVEREVTDAYKSTERRLYALPILVKRVSNSEEYLASLEATLAQGHSKDIVRFTRSSTISADDKAEALIADGRAKLAADQHEIDTMHEALKNIENDKYYLTVKGRYFESLTDEEIAKHLTCDDEEKTDRTVRRHRGRLVRVVAIWLYGAKAV